MSITLSDIRDFTASVVPVSGTPVYMAKLPDGQDETLCVYHSKHSHAYKTAIGGHDLKSYEETYCTWLIHWNRSPRETENFAKQLFEVLRGITDVEINNKRIQFILPLYELQDIGCDDAGVYEYVIEAVVISKK